MLILDADTKFDEDNDGKLIPKGDKPIERVQEGMNRHVSFRLASPPERKLAECRELYTKVAVRDYGDDYHKSREELLENNPLYELYEPLKNGSSKYKNLVKYIEYMRAAHKYITAISESSAFIFDQEKFVAEVYRGEVWVGGFNPPKYTGKDRKDIDYGLVAEYIMDDSLDPNDLIPKSKIDLERERDDFYYEMSKDLDGYLKKLFPGNQYDYIFEGARQLREHRENGTVKGSYVFGRPATEGIVRRISEKDFKKSRKVPFFNEIIEGINRDIANEKRIFGYGSNNELYSELDAMDDFRYDDEKRQRKNEKRMPKFKGSLLNNKALKKYCAAVDDYLNENTIVEYKGKQMLLEDARTEKVRDFYAKFKVIGKNGRPTSQYAYRAEDLWNVGIYEKERKEDLRKKAEKASNRKVKYAERELQKIHAQRDALLGKNNGHIIDWDNDALTEKDKKELKKLQKLANMDSDRAVMKMLDIVEKSEKKKKGGKKKSKEKPMINTKTKKNKKVSKSEQSVRDEYNRLMDMDFTSWEANNY